MVGGRGDRAQWCDSRVCPASADPAANPAVAAAPPPAPSEPISVTLSVSDNEAQASFELPGGLAADLSLSFENVVGLTPTALEVWVTLVNPVDPALLSRLPLDGVGIPVGFPVLIRISPSATSTLSFSGAYTISLHTHNLQLLPNLPLSLFKAPEGGAFRDITKWEGRGSYRDDGGGGDFSEFMIVLDLRPIDGVIAGKFDDLQALINDNAASMPAAVVTELQSELVQARTAYQAGNLRQAIAQMRDFSRYVKRHGGAEIPDVWRANCSPVVNVAGLLRSSADTLKFSLDRKQNH